MGMPRHAKNNTASSFFTAHEKQQLTEYGTQKKRLGKESFRNFDCCSLCLKELVEPKACQKGHLFCKECIYENLLSQKSKIKRDQKLYKQYTARIQNEKKEEEMEKQRAELEAFDKLECSVLNTADAANKSPGSELSKSEEHSKKFTAFWMPSLTPEAKEGMKKPSKITKCPEGNHPMKLKHLSTVNFTPSVDRSSKFQCLVCHKSFTNASTGMLLKPCGHVVCKPCWNDLVKDTTSCPSCQKGFTSEDIIQLASGGTGFAGHHGAALEVTKLTPSAWV